MLRSSNGCVWVCGLGSSPASVPRSPAIRAIFSKAANGLLIDQVGPDALEDVVVRFFGAASGQINLNAHGQAHVATAIAAVHLNGRSVGLLRSRRLCRLRRRCFSLWLLWLCTDRFCRRGLTRLFVTGQRPKHDEYSRLPGPNYFTRLV